MLNKCLAGRALAGFFTLMLTAGAAKAATYDVTNCATTVDRLRYTLKFAMRPGTSGFYGTARLWVSVRRSAFWGGSFPEFLEGLPIVQQKIEILNTDKPTDAARFILNRNIYARSIDSENNERTYKLKFMNEHKIAAFSFSSRNGENAATATATIIFEDCDRSFEEIP